MIAEFNRKCLINACFCLAGSVFCYTIAFLFFRYLSEFSADQFRLNIPDLTFLLIAIGALLIITFTAWRQYKKDKLSSARFPSPFYEEFEVNSGASLMVDGYVREVSGCAYFLSRFFLSGPEYFFQAIQHFKKRLSANFIPEDQLKRTLAGIEIANKWQTFKDYPGMEQAVLVLAHMRLIDFSGFKEEAKFKAKAK